MLLTYPHAAFSNLKDVSQMIRDVAGEANALEEEAPTIANRFVDSPIKL
jgi:hypothetical protein